MRTKTEKLIPWVLAAITTALLAYFLLWHLRLGLVRYFDVDEFAYLHWAYNIFSGKRLYVDFFNYVAPGFQLALVTLFWFGIGGTWPLLAARVAEFVIFTLLCVGVIALFWQMRRSWLAIVAGALLAFLPMPIDKFIEVRPDTLAVLLALIGTILQIAWMRKGKRDVGFWCGVFYGASCIVLQKMLPYVAVAGLVAFLAVITGGVPSDSERRFKGLRAFRTYLLPVGLGLLSVMGCLFLWLLTLGDISKVYYSLFTLPLETSKIGQYFIMMSFLFFYPNGIFYGQDGYPLGLIVNHIVWMVGWCVGITRLFTPYLTNGKKRVWEEILVSSIFVVQGAIYVYYVPFKHTQYLIPVAVFVSWYAADALHLLWIRFKTSRVSLWMFCGGFVILIWVLLRSFIQTNQPKLAWTNQQALRTMEHIFATIPKTEYVLDLVGLTIYYPDPYVACCIPFGQMAPFMSRQLPSLSDTLSRTKTKYIYQGGVKRVGTLQPQDQEYIGKHYVPVGDGELLVARE